MARQPVRITDTSTNTAAVVKTVPSSSRYGVVVRTAGGVTVANPTTAVRVTNSTSQRVPGRVTQDTNPWTVHDDFTTFLSTHFTIAASSGRAINLTTPVRMYRVTNWSTSSIVLVKASSIPSDSDASASRVGIAAKANIPNSDVFPITSTTIWVRSPTSHAVTVEAFK